MANDDANFVQPVLNKSSKDKFNLILTLPPIMQGINTNDPNDRTGKTVITDSLQFSIFGTIAPPQTVHSHDIRFMGQNMKITGHSRPAQNPVNTAFVIDNRFKNYWVLWKWLQILNDEVYSQYDKNDLYDPYKNKNWHAYMADLEMHALDEYNVPIAKFKYLHSFITDLEGIQYNHQDPDQILSRFGFVFGQFTMELL